MQSVISRQVLRCSCTWCGATRRYIAGPVQKGLGSWPCAGTGKTLVARALAASASRAHGRPVAFFMRKGADVLSKWVGEAEQQLRLLFEAHRRLQSFGPHV